MFSRAAKEDPRDLIIQHNLTAENLLFAARMGGLPVPSLAITKAESPMKNFGEITLLGDVNMADPRQGIKAYGADIYSPRYPRVTYQFTPNMRARAEKQAKAGLDATNTYIDWSEVERDGADELNRQPALMWEFLTSKGITPTIVRVEPKPLDPAIQPFANDTRNSFELAQDPAFQAAAWAAHQEMLTQAYGDAKEAQAEIEKMQQTARERGRSQVVNGYASGLEQYRRDKAVAGRVDTSATKRAMDAQIHDARLTDEFRASNKQLMRDLAPNERMFQGYTDSGKRRYKPHTLDNVIAILKKELRGGENFNYGAGSLRAKFTPQFKSVAQIRANKDRLVSNEQFEAIKAEANNDLQMIAESLNKPTDTAIAIMEDAPRMGLTRAAAQYDVDLSDSQREMIGEYMTRLRNMPTEYFEGKLLRAVGVGEFKAAVVPENVSDDVLKLLDREGVTVSRYTGSRDGADRARAIQQAANEIPGLMFSRTPAWRSELRDQTGGMPTSEAQAHVTSLTKKWKNGPPITVVATPADLPMEAPDDARGVYWKGKVWIVAGPHNDRTEIARTLAHEAVAHFGLRNMLNGDEWRQYMRNIQLAIKSGNKALTAIRDQVRSAYVDGDGKLYLTEQQEADEIAAKVAEQAVGPDGEFRPGFGFVKAVYAKIMQFLRDLGLDVNLTLAEVQGMLVLAQKNLEAGKRTVGQGDVVVAAGRGDQALSRTPASTIRAAITKAYGNLLDKLEAKGLVTIAQTEREAIEAAAQARADKTGWDVEQIKRSMLASVQMQRAMPDTIMVDGVERPTANSNGQPIHPTEQGVVNFWRWFGDDSNVDANGRPKVLYHSTLDDKTVFDRNGKFMGYTGTSGISLTDNPEMASRYLDRYGSTRYDGVPFQKNVMPVYAKFGKVLTRQEPLKTSYGLGAPLPANYVAAHKAMGYDTLIRSDAISKKGAVKHSDAKNAIKGNEYVLTEPTQIKSATGNDGSFNPADMDIRRSANGNIEGFFDRQTGKSFLVADNLTAASAPGTLMHEVGIHMAAGGKMEALFKRAGSLLKTGTQNEFIQRVKARMARAGETSDEEAAAYIVTEYENDRAKAPITIGKWLADLTTAVRAWLFSKGIILKADQLTVADIAAVARANARSMARGGPNGGPGGGQVFSRTALPATLNIDGKDRPTTNSNGQPIHPTEEGVRNFWRWFADSRVVDEQGRPLVVYHGSTRGGIRNSTVQHSFFTSSQDVARTYSEDDYNGAKGDDPVVQEVYLRMENPLVADAEGNAWMRVPFEGKNYTTDDLARLAKKRGNDGVIIRNLEDNVNDEELPPSDVYITLGGKSQIKSATGNNGDFDPANPDIRYALGDDAFRLGITPRKHMPVTDVQKAVDQLTAKWKDGPKIKVVQSPEELPVDAPFDARGLIHNGNVY
ncbi:MAG: hypothetical protein KA781_06595, partial [Aquabacterium sp.]|nr:hypothetical protein [Aquabacterium sp.]